MGNFKAACNRHCCGVRRRGDPGPPPNLFTHSSSQVDVREMLAQTRFSLMEKQMVLQAPQDPPRVHTGGTLGGGCVPERWGCEQGGEEQGALGPLQPGEWPLTE